MSQSPAQRQASEEEVRANDRAAAIAAAARAADAAAQELSLSVEKRLVDAA